MKRESVAFLERLLTAASPSGYEGPARRVWLDEMEPVADELTVDVHGNSIATINPDGAPHVMLAGHIDEIGFQVCHIDDSGFARFRAIGGHDLRAVAGRRVHVHTDGGPVLGVIGKKPIHLIRDRNRATTPNISEFWIDCGFSSGRAARRAIAIGDPITYTEGFELVRDKIAVARAFDNKVGAFVVAETLRALKRSRSLKARVTAVATVQEEIGLRGAQTSAYGLAPDAGIAVDVTWATDNPGGDAKEIGEVKLGRGPVLVRGPNANPVLLGRLRQAASKSKIAVQMRAIPRASGNDANAIQISRAGVAAAVVGVPQRYMHSPVEICHLGDLDNAVKLIAATLRGMDRKISFIPS